MTGGLARRYARALLDLAREAGSLDATGQELLAVAAAFDEPRLRAVVLNPAIESGARHKVVGGVVDAVWGVAAGRQPGAPAGRPRSAGHPAADRAGYDALVDAEVGRTRVLHPLAAPLALQSRRN